MSDPANAVASGAGPLSCSFIGANPTPIAIAKVAGVTVAAACGRVEFSNE